MPLYFVYFAELSLCKSWLLRANCVIAITKRGTKKTREPQRNIYFDLLNSFGVFDMDFFFLTTGSPCWIAKLLFHGVNLWLFTFNHFVVRFACNISFPLIFRSIIAKHKPFFVIIFLTMHKQKYSPAHQSKI